MRWHGVAAVGGALGLLVSCAAAQPAVKKAKNEPAPARQASIGRRYVDPVFGFELVRPTGNWHMEVNDEESPEGVAVPLVLHENDSGAQVVVQIAPAIASPGEFADRLVAGLRRHPGFIAAEPSPLEGSDSAVGFGFSLGESVQGRVAVIEGGPGQMYMLMATWPSSSPDAEAGVDKIFRSVRPVPQG